MTGGTQLVLFGPQLTQTQWTPEFLRRLQLEIRNNPQLEFLRHCLIQLETFVASTPLTRENVALVSQLGTLAGFARGEAIPDPQRLQGNILLAPLTIVSQVVDWLRIPPSGELIVQGFCIGFLSAAVVSSTHTNDRSQFERYVANSIRLAACIGFLIDQEDSLKATSDRATAISVRCQSPSHRAALETIIDLFPEVCIREGFLAIGILADQ